MKVFEIHLKCGEKEWIAANGVIEALATYCSITNTHIWEFDQDDEIIEVPESDWDNYSILMDEDGESITLRERMKTVIEPEYLASTVY